MLSPFRRVIRGISNLILPYYLLRLPRGQKEVGEDIIVSFTSFPARINDVWKVVETLKNQSVRPERIILWLSKEQFPERKSIPQSLWEREDGIFEIRLVDGDIRSHKKYFYAMQEFSRKTIVTCDDDIYYHHNMLKNLLSASQLYPNCIIANNTKQILFDEYGEVFPYYRWSRHFEPLASVNRVQIGVGGVLYPPFCLHDLVFRNDLFMELAPLADDLWLNMMARLKKTPVVQSAKQIFPLPIKSQAPRLTSVNNGEASMNDVQIRNMREWLSKNHYDDVYSSHYLLDAKK